jgi:hypothetical protein
MKRCYYLLYIVQSHWLIHWLIELMFYLWQEWALQCTCCSCFAKPLASITKYLYRTILADSNLVCWLPKIRGAMTTSWCSTDPVVRGPYTSPSPRWKLAWLGKCAYTLERLCPNTCLPAALAPSAKATREHLVCHLRLAHRVFKVGSGGPGA